MSRRLPRASSVLFGVRYFRTWEDAERVRAAIFPGAHSKVVSFARGFAVRAYDGGPFYGARETHTRFDPARKRQRKAHKPRPTRLEIVGEEITRAEDRLEETEPRHQDLALLRLERLRAERKRILDRRAARSFPKTKKKAKRRKDPQGPYHSALTEARARARAEGRPQYMVHEHGSGVWHIAPREPAGPHVKVLVDERAVRHGAPDPQRRRGDRGRRQRIALYPLCHRGPTVEGHEGSPWTCRGCGKQACAACAHHFGQARDPRTRTFTCAACARRRR